MKNDFCNLYHMRLDEKIALPFRVRSVGQRMGNSSFSSRETKHNFYELIWTTEGCGELAFEDKRQRIDSQSVILIAPGIQRRYYTLGKKWRYHWITLTGPLIGEIFDSMNFEPVTIRHAGECPEQLFLRLETLASEFSESGIRECCQLAFQIMLLASRDSGPTETRSIKVQNAIALVEQNIDNPMLNVDWLAQQLATHRSSLSRKFKKEVGLSPSEFIIQSRLRQAMSLLRTEDSPLSLISKSCGFSNTDYFIHLFHQRVGITPGHFREDQRI